MVHVEAEEFRDERRPRACEHAARIADGLDPAVVHHRDGLGERERLGLVVGDVDRGKAEALLEHRELHAHMGAQPCIEVRHRLVEQHEARLVHQRAGERHPLLLAAGERRRRLAARAREPDHVEDARGALCDLGARDAAHLERKADVLGDRHVRPHRIGLEHDAELAPLGHQVDAGVVVEHRLAGDLDRAGIRGLETGEAAQNRGLAAARRSEQRQGVALLDGERDAVDRDEVAE